MGQTVNSSLIIGNPIRIVNLLVAQNDFPNVISFNEAKDACIKLGKGWRLPTKAELNILYVNKNLIGGFVGGYYWSSKESMLNAWY